MPGNGDEALPPPTPHTNPAISQWLPQIWVKPEQRWELDSYCLWPKGFWHFGPHHFLQWWVCPGHCHLFSNILELNPLNAWSPPKPWQPRMSASSQMLPGWELILCFKDLSPILSYIWIYFHFCHWQRKSKRSNFNINYFSAEEDFGG